MTQVFTPGQEWARHHDIRLNKGRLCRSSFTPFSSLSHTIFVQRTGEGFCSMSCYVSSVPRHSPSTRYTVLPGSVMQYQYILPPTFRVPTVPSSSSFKKNERKTLCFLVNCEIPLQSHQLRLFTNLFDLIKIHGEREPTCVWCHGTYTSVTFVLVGLLFIRGFGCSLVGVELCMTGCLKSSPDPRIRVRS